MSYEDQKGNIAEPIKQPKIDLNEIIECKPLPQMKTLDHVTVCTDVYRISGFEKEKIPFDEILFLSSNDSYLIHNIYRTKFSGVDKGIAYFWQGSKSSILEKGTVALLTVDLCEKSGGEISQIRIEQGRESEDFLSLFKGFVVSDSESTTDETIVYDIRAFGKGAPKIYRVDRFDGNLFLLRINLMYAEILLLRNCLASQ
jgi:hypothetical protein